MDNKWFAYLGKSDDKLYPYNVIYGEVIDFEWNTNDKYFIKLQKKSKLRVQFDAYMKWDEKQLHKDINKPAMACNTQLLKGIIYLKIEF